MSLSKPESIRRGISNSACIARIINGPCTNILRNVLTNQISLPDLKKKYSSLIHDLHMDSDIFLDLERLLAESNENYSDFEIPALYFFLRWISDIPIHESRWGRYLYEKDRSLSANIERIYRIRAKYRRLPHGSINVSIEKEWENIFNIVKELETFIGSGTENQDAMKKIRNSSLDPDVEDILIKHLLRYDPNGELDRLLEYEMKLHLTPKPDEVKVYGRRRRYADDYEFEMACLMLLSSKKMIRPPYLTPIRKPSIDPYKSTRKERAPSPGRPQHSGYPTVEETDFDVLKSMEEEKSPSPGRPQHSGYPSVEETYFDVLKSMKEEKSPSPERPQLSGYPSVEETDFDVLKSMEEKKWFSLGPLKEPYMDPSIFMREQRALSPGRPQHSGYLSVEETYFDVLKSMKEEKSPSPGRPQLSGYPSVEETDFDVLKSMEEKKWFSLGPLKEPYKDPSISIREQRGMNSCKDI